jgi:putative (di)nucleoside polyphosphate hydrolase
MKERLAVGAFVRNKEGNYLLLKTRAKVGEVVEEYWDIPKGGVEENEDLLGALKRELIEELGSKKFRIVRKLGINFSFEFPIEIKERTGFDSEKVELFLVEFYGDEKDIKVDNDEIVGFAFLNENEFLKRASFKNTKRAFLQFLKGKLDF